MPIYSKEEKVQLAVQAIENSKKKPKKTLKRTSSCTDLQHPPQYIVRQDE
jgi:hypothetical protein